MTKENMAYLMDLHMRLLSTSFLSEEEALLLVSAIPLLAESAPFIDRSKLDKEHVQSLRTWCRKMPLLMGAIPPSWGGEQSEYFNFVAGR